MPNRTHFEMLEEIRLQHNVVRHSVDRLGELIAAYEDTVPIPVQPGEKSRRKVSIKSLDLWTEWLREHGPSYRQDIWDGTGINLSTNATPHVRKWKDHMEIWDDDQIDQDTVLNITGPKKAMGRPPVIYFLWSQRYDVLPKFGVGPDEPDPLLFKPTVEPDLGLKYLETVTADRELTTEDEVVLSDLLDRADGPTALTGVIRPDGIDPDYGEELTMDDLYNLWSEGTAVELDGMETQSNENGDGESNG